MDDTRLSSSISLEAARVLRDGVLPHVPPSAAPVSTHMRLTLEADADDFPEISFNDMNREEGWRVAMTFSAEENLWFADVLLPQEPTLLFYHFELADGTVIRERRQKEGVEKPLFGVWAESEFRIAVYAPSGKPPDWLRGQVFYQIFPDRFARSFEPPTPRINHTYQFEALHLQWGEPPEHPPKGRDFFGGNLRGIIEKLNYLADLGVTALYLTPIFSSPTNHRYDTIDYFQIDPQLGSLDDFRDLLEQAGKRGIRLLLDGVFNHCSSDSVYFKSAQSNRTSPYFRWFHFNQWPDDYVGWVGVETMPELVECPEVEDFFFGSGGVALYWLSLGAAGWRTDVTPWITDEYWRRFRKAVRAQYPDAYLVAEDWTDSSKRLLGNSFDATMNYRFAYTVVGFAGGRLSPLELDDRLETLRRDTPPDHFNAQLNLIDSHDTPRALTVLKRSQRRLMLAAALQLAYPGVPCVFYGDEAGIEGSYAESSRKSFPWGFEDPILLEFYRRAIHARRSTPALIFGDVLTNWIDPQGGYAFTRAYEGEQVVAAFNNSGKPLPATIRLRHAAPGEWTDLLGRIQNIHVEDDILQLVLPPFGSAWMSRKL